MSSTPQILETISQQAAQLVAENLRSTAVAIARLEPLIARANELGHTHAAILEAVQAGGLQTSMNNYKVYLHRARQHRSKSPALSVAEEIPPPSPGGTQQRADPIPVEPTEPSQVEAGSANSVTSVRDSLQRAKQTASRDFSKIARQQLRKPAK